MRNFDVRDDMLAIGNATGKTLVAKVVDDDVSVVAEFMPRHARPCNVVSFCPTDKNLLLSGLDKVRNDYCLLVWDIATGRAQNPTTSPSPGGSLSSLASSTPKLQLGTSEAVSSAAWFPLSPATIVAGMGNKWIRIFDTRAGAAAQQPTTVIATKSVHGLSPSPFDRVCFASYAEASVNIWDARKTAEPVLALDAGLRHGIAAIAWSPARRGMLAASGRESGTIKVWELQDSGGGAAGGADGRTEERTMGIDAEGGEASGGADLPASSWAAGATGSGTLGSEERDGRTAVVWKSRSVTLNANVMAFAWAPGSSTPFRSEIMSFDARDCIRLSAFSESAVIGWRPQGGLVFADGRNLKTNPRLEPADIGEVIKHRAVAGYAFDPAENAKLVARKSNLAPANDSLVKFWQWIADMTSTTITRISASDKSHHLLGISDLLQSQFSNGTLSNTTTAGTFIRHESNNRRLALSICGLDASDGTSLEAIISSRGESKEKARAAFVALFFCSDMDRAVRVLNEARDERLRMAAAILLSSLAEGKSAAWLALCKSLAGEVEDPWLRAIFALISSEGDWKVVLSDEALPLNDRLIIALLYLPDDELARYIADLKERSVREGDLNGLKLTGFGSVGLDLLESYIDITCDIQTVCLVVSVIPSMLALPRVGPWIES
ncbi:hypothetical protein HK101_007042 [Irineochytrium annulatum]|nr:hypothetical protein HK101_007042 [Irineochytrium annulatum]